MFDEGLVKKNRLTDDIKGLNEFKEISKEFSPEKVEEVKGIASSIIRQVAREFTSHKKSVIYGRMGVCTQEFGGLAMWLVNALNIITGNFDDPGGAMFSLPAVDIKPFSTKGHIGKWTSRVRKAPEFANELSVATLAEDILVPGKGQIKAMIVNAGNPILSTPNGTQLKAAFKSLDFLVSIDIYINETSSLADIILPPATGLEVDHYDIVFHSLAVRNTAKYSQALFKPEKGAKYDWEIFKGLKKAYLKKKGNYGIKKRLYGLIDDFITPERMLSQALKKGNWSDSINLSKLKKNPHGIDLGSLASQLPEGLYTKDKKINLVPDEIKNDL
jgi:anaerobic selenocysteine-containing dehydrogenase